MIRYTPLRLEDLCINKILSLVWKENFEEIHELGDFLLDPVWKEKFCKRHDIIKWCFLHEKDQ